MLTSSGRALGSSQDPRLGDSATTSFHITSQETPWKVHSSKTGQTPTEPILLMPSPPAAVHTGKKYPEGSLKGKELSPVSS